MLGLIESIEISDLMPSSDLVRSDIGDINHLAISIRDNGLLQPIVVRCIINRFEIIAGNRRFLACKKLRWKKIPCHIVELSDKEAFEVSLIENVQRKTMNPIEEAKAYQRYVKDYGWGGISELARRIGKSQEYVTKRLKLLELPLKIQEEVVRRRIKPSIAEELAFIKDEKEQSKLAQIVASRHTTIRQFRALSIDKDSLNACEDHVFFDQQNPTQKNMFISFDKSILTLKLTLKRLNDIMEATNDNWMVYELLWQHRMMIHSQIDLLVRQRRKYSSITYDIA